jgi:hypothetical protein
LELNKLLQWLFALLFPAVEGPDEDAPPEEDTPPDEDALEPEPNEDAPEPEDDNNEQPPEPRVSRAQKAIIDARVRAQTAERELAEARAQLEQTRRAPAQPSADQMLWQQEEETLRNPETSDWQKYAINANRAARQATVTSQTALQRAEDLSDRAEFAAVGVEKPKLYAAYKDRVEQHLAAARKEGRNPPRKEIMTYLVGKDMMEGKVKGTVNAAKPTVNARASARSDVAASGGARMSDAEKRAKRLENVRI